MIKFSQTLQHRYLDMTSYLASSKMSFTNKDGHLMKALEKEKNDTASQLLKGSANRNYIQSHHGCNCKGQFALHGRQRRPRWHGTIT